VNKKDNFDELDGLKSRALARHSAVSWIEQCRKQGYTFCECTKRASELDWQGRYFSARTLEDWYYAFREEGFKALSGSRRSDRGRCRALDPAIAGRIVQMRKEQPQMTVTSILERLRVEGVIETGNGCSASSVYRFLQRCGLDRHRLRALKNEVGGPTKAWESAAPNLLWMADLMDGPSLHQEGKRGSFRTWLMAFIDDHSRLVTHAQFYAHQNIRVVLDCLRQALERRGLPKALYTDQGKVFVGSQLRLVCANLGIDLLHARPYAAWSKGKIERFFRTLQDSFLASLKFEPVADLDSLNRGLWIWLEQHYHKRAHSALSGETPSQRFERSPIEDPPQNWQDLFFERLHRRVRLDATVTLGAELWEVPVHLRGLNIELRRDCFNPEKIEIWYRDELCARASRCQKQLNSNFFPSGNYESRSR
jgi:transposase InsO family protein